MNIKLIDCDYHRNGVGGEGFHCVVFEYEGERFVGIVFDGRGRVAVTRVLQLAAGSAADTWRGDHFEPELRGIVEAFEQLPMEQRMARFKLHGSAAGIGGLKS